MTIPTWDEIKNGPTPGLAGAAFRDAVSKHLVLSPYAIVEYVPCRLGETLTRQRKTTKSDDGYIVEQYVFTLGQYADRTEPSYDEHVIPRMIGAELDNGHQSGIAIERMAWNRLQEAGLDLMTPCALPIADLRMSDILTFGLIQDAHSRLKARHVAPMQDGRYGVFLSDISWRQLWGDPSFQAYFKLAEIGKDLNEYLVGDYLIQKGMPDRIVKSDRPHHVVTHTALVAGDGFLIRGENEDLRPAEAEDDFITEFDGPFERQIKPFERDGKPVIAHTWKWTGDFAVSCNVGADGKPAPDGGHAIMIEHAYG
jgi:hypothetical protein